MEALETILGERLVDQVEVLSHHALRGELWDRAVTYYRQAGAKARAHSAYREVVICTEQALDALRHLSEDRDTRELGVDLRIDLRNALMPLGELGQMLETLREAETLAAALNDQHRLGLIARHMARYFWNMGDYERSIESGQRALSLTTGLGDAALQVTANVLLGAVNRTLGDYRQAIVIFRQNAAALQDEARYEFYNSATPPASLSRTELAMCLAETGAFSEGILYANKGRQIAEIANHAFSLCLACSASGRAYLQQRDFAWAIPLREHARSLCQDANLDLLSSSTASALGYGYAVSGYLGKALPLLEEAVESSPDLAGLDSSTQRMVYLSEADVMADRLEDAKRLALRAYELSLHHKKRSCEAYALHLLGAITARSDPSTMTQAEDYYRQAIALAHELGMRPPLAHCHRGLGSLYGRTGRLGLARHELSTAIDLYRQLGARRKCGERHGDAE